MLTVLQKQHEQKVSARSFLQQLLQRSLRLAISFCWSFEPADRWRTAFYFELLY